MTTTERQRIQDIFRNDAREKLGASLDDLYREARRAVHMAERADEKAIAEHIAFALWWLDSSRSALASFPDNTHTHPSPSPASNSSSAPGTSSKAAA